MQNNSRKFEELVFCDWWFLVSGFRILVSDSGFWFPIPDSGFRFLALRVALKVQWWPLKQAPFSEHCIMGYSTRPQGLINISIQDGHSCGPPKTGLFTEFKSLTQAGKCSDIIWKRVLLSKEIILTELKLSTREKHGMHGSVYEEAWCGINKWLSSLSHSACVFLKVH